MTFSSLITFEIYETRAVLFDPVLCILNGSSFEPYSVSFEITFHGCFQQQLNVYQYLKNLSVLCLRDLLKWKYPHRIYCAFFKKLVPGT